MFRNSSLAIAVFALIGSMLAAVLVYVTSDGLRLWIRAHSFVAAKGVVTISEIRERPGRHGLERLAFIQYEFQAAGAKWVSERVSVDVSESLPLSWVGLYPKGTSITVWHDPSRPSDSIIERRFTRLLLVFCLFSVMFVAMAVVFGADAIDAVVWRSRRPMVGVVVHPMAQGCVLHIPAYSAVATGAMGTIAGSVIGLIIGIGFAAGSPDLFVSASEVWGLVGVIVVPGPVAFGCERYLIRRGRNDLIIDEAMATVTVPPGPGRDRLESIPLRSIRDVDVVVWDHAVHTQYGTTTIHTYVPTLVHQTDFGGWRNTHLVEWRDEGKAMSLAKWLRARLGVRSAKVGKGGVGLGGERLGSVLEDIDSENVR